MQPNQSSGVRRNRFTFVEIMVVVIILGILATVVAVKLTGRTQDARINAAQSAIANFGTALDAYEMDNGAYPTTQQGLQALLEEPNPKPIKWKGPYLQQGKLTDPWGNAYVYKAGADALHNKNSYDLYSFGVNGTDNQGGDDDITNWGNTGGGAAN
ncbi:MAG: type II secretion system protein GspG [Lentisphaerae bacterium RIFOXYB12_FULL_65_16]|nr:MAG: type II secretion system protein GspG [Lentisphaerae bacterium RIFOXYA12_64_32]OGV93278.1 MAG: type II secretion system protein GspG [Lentisphaerae bacterium RIFOXYB12_FULL_65_16]